MRYLGISYTYYSDGKDSLKLHTAKSKTATINLTLPTEEEGLMTSVFQYIKLPHDMEREEALNYVINSGEIPDLRVVEFLRSLLDKTTSYTPKGIEEKKNRGIEELINLD